MPVTKNCVVCSKPFSTVPSHAGRKHTCSKTCSSKYVSERKDGLKNGTSLLVNCPICSKEFKIWKSRLQGRETACCSVDCSAQYKRFDLDDLKIKDLYKSGLSIYEIGAMLNVTGGTIQHRLIQLGVPRRSPSENNKGSKNCMYGKTHTLEAIQKIKDANKKQFDNPENREKHAILTAKQIAKGKTGKKNNSLELALKSILTENFDFDFVHQYRIDRYVFDFYIPSANLLIEADGTFWHSDPRFYPDPEKLSFTQKKNKINDEKKTNHAILKGYKLLRVWEEDVINSKDLVITQIKVITVDTP